jgi:hypothetical protein
MHNLSTIYVSKPESLLWVSCGSTVDSLWVSHIVDFKARLMPKISIANMLILPNSAILIYIVCAD